MRSEGRGVTMSTSSRLPAKSPKATLHPVSNKPPALLSYCFAAIAHTASAFELPARDHGRNQAHH